MKKRVILLLAGFLVCLPMLFAQEVPNALVMAFKKGNSQELGKYWGNELELVIQKHTERADKRTATNKMARFFSGNRVSDFRVNHQGKRDESSFIVGTLTTANGKFRVNCFFKKTGDKYLIHQIRIDKTNE